MRVGIFGLSGSGKTTFVKKIIEKCPEWQSSSASEIIKKHNGEINHDYLNHQNVIKNQFILIENIKKTKGVFLLELHNVIELPSLIEIVEEEIINSLGLDFSIFIYTNPIKILNNRLINEKKRKIIGVEDIELVQNKAVKLFLETFERNYIIINSDFPVSPIIQLINNFNEIHKK